MGYRLHVPWLLPWTSDASQKSKLLPAFWPTDYKSELSTTPVLGLINFLKQFTGLKATFHLQIAGLLWKDITLEQPSRRGAQDKVWGKGTKLPCAGAPVFPNLHMFTNQEALSFWGFLEALLYNYDWLNHWPFPIDLISSPSSFPGGWLQGRLKVPTL